jgi:hypothetical protein
MAKRKLAAASLRIWYYSGNCNRQWACIVPLYDCILLT